DRQRHRPRAMAFDVAVTEVFIETPAKRSQRADDLLAFARPVEHFVHYLTGDATSSAARSAAMGLDRPNPPDALARHAPAANPHRHGKAGGRSDGVTVLFSEKKISRRGTLIETDPFLEAGEVFARAA